MASAGLSCWQATVNKLMANAAAIDLKVTIMFLLGDSLRGLSLHVLEFDTTGFVDHPMYENSRDNRKYGIDTIGAQ